MEEKASPTHRFSGANLTILRGFWLILVWALAPLAYSTALTNVYQLPKSSAFAGLGTATLFFVLLTGAVLGKTRTVPRYFLYLAGFFLLASVSLARSEAPAEGVELMLALAAAVIWFLVGTLTLARRESLIPVFLGVALSGTATAVLGVLQWKGVDAWAAPGLWFSRLPVTDAPGAVFGHVNVAAEWVVVGLLAKVALLSGRGEGRRLLGFRRVLGAALLLPDIAFVVISGTRAAWAALLVAGLLLLLPAVLRARRDGSFERLARGTALVCVVAVLAFVLLDQWVMVPGRGGGPEVRPRERLLALSEVGAGTLGERTTLWANTLAMVQAFPFLGVGPGNWKVAYPAWARRARVHEAGTFSPSRQPERTHSEPLQMAAEVGVLALLLMAGLVLSAVLSLLARARRGLGDARETRGALMILAALLAFGMVAFPFQGAPTAAVFFVILGSATGATARGIRLSPRGAAVVAGCVALVGVVLWAHFHAAFRASSERRVAQIGTLIGPTHLATAPERRQRLLQVLDAADRAATRQPGSYRHQLLRSALLSDLGLGDEAALVLKHAQRLHPNLVQALLALANLERRAGHSAAAGDLIRRALGLMPDSYEVRMTYGLYLESLGRLVPAEYQYRAALTLREHNPDARLRLARLLLTRDEGRVPAEEILSILGPVEVQISNDADRMEDLARILEHPAFTMVSADVFGPSGSKSLEVWRRAQYLARGRSFDARLEAGLEGLKRHLAGAPLSPGRLEEQLRLVDILLEENPIHLKALYFRAHLLERLGRDDEALIQWAVIVRGLMMAKERQDQTLQWVLESAFESKERIELRLKARDVRRTMGR